jgi:hypothetical protein
VLVGRIVLILGYLIRSLLSVEKNFTKTQLVYD